MGVDVKEYKKTATIHAAQWDGDNHTDIAWWAAGYGVLIHWMEDNKLRIPTLEGPMYASVGDFIAKGVNNEFWAIKPDIMAKTYEEV